MDDVKTRDPRGELRDDAASVALMDYPDSTEEIPVLDFAPYLNGEPGGREKVAARLREITMTVGFFYLKNHGIPQSLIDDAFVQNRRFHALPLDEKTKVPWTEREGYKLGYQTYGKDEDYRPEANVNILKDVRPNLLGKFTFVHRRDNSRPPVSFWPENLPGFKETMQAYADAVLVLGRKFLPLWCMGLGLPLNFFDQMFAEPHLQPSLLHYPPQKEIGNRQYGISPHTDNAMMTFLAQQEVPGLAVRMPSGHWRAVGIKPGTLLVNTGNSLVRWTNEEYLSTKHRVLNNNPVDRYSIPVFFGPSNDTVVEVLPTCHGPGNPPKYEPITYGDMRKWYYG